MIYLWTFVFSIIGGILYRMGGIGDPYNTKVRDFGVPLVALGLLALIGGRAEWYIWVSTFILMFASMTTYMKFGEQEDVLWYNWFAVGTVYGLSALPFTIVTGEWTGFMIRLILLAFGIMIWSEVVDKDWLEEWGRGFLFVSMTPLLLLTI